jgi:NDP-sugar pyrophosphorylase family protein
MALQYYAENTPLGYTYFRDKPTTIYSGRILDYGSLVAIYDINGNRCDPADFIKIRVSVLREKQRLIKERLENEKPLKNI